MKFEIEFCKVKFENPLVLVSGVLGVTGNSLKMVAESGAGGVTTKSIWLKEHQGHPNPVIIATEHWMLNAVGLPDAGVEKAREEIAVFRKGSKKPLIASIVGGKFDDFAEIAEAMNEIKPDIIEVNISCPNVQSEFGRPFACFIPDAAKVTEIVKKRVKNIPVVVKLSPNVPNIGEIAKACETAGADAIAAINTVGPGMAIDIEMRRPILANKVGGVSGPAIKPIAVKAIYDIYASVKVPIIGMGGVINGRDAIELMMAGATLVGVGTALYYRDIGAFSGILGEMKSWCEENGVKNLKEIIGAAHEGKK